MPQITKRARRYGRTARALKSSGSAHPSVIDAAVHGEKPALPGHTRLLERVMAHIYYADGQPISRRPYLTWSHYFDDSGTLKAVDCVKTTTNSKKPAGAFEVDKPDLKRLTQSIQTEAFYFADIFCLKNTLEIFENTALSHVSLSLLPDFILRRTDAILHSSSKNTIKVFIPGPSLTRTGLVFNTVAFHENSSGIIAPEAHDAPFKQKPFIPVEKDGSGKIVFSLSQEEIDKICLIARHYTQYCHVNGLPVTWPKPGTYGPWPKNFMAFEHGVPNHKVALPWFNNNGGLSAPEPPGY